VQVNRPEMYRLKSALQGLVDIKYAGGQGQRLQSLKKTTIVCTLAFFSTRLKSRPRKVVTQSVTPALAGKHPLFC